MENTDKDYLEIMKIANSLGRVSNRVKELEKLGWSCMERPMGSGGKGQVKILNNETRIQIGYGHSRNNYAMCVVILN